LTVAQLFEKQPRDNSFKTTAQFKKEVNCPKRANFYTVIRLKGGEKMPEARKEGWGAAEGKDVDRTMIDHIYKQFKDIKWEPHPINGNVQLGFVLTKKNDGVEITSLLAKIPKGEVVPEHTHEVHDILCPLSGKGKVWIQGIGDLELKRGVVVNVPPGAVHKVYEVTEEMEVYDVFSGPIL
jgi:quercetin dioxygenase-like cupin family protein